MHHFTLSQSVYFPHSVDDAIYTYYRFYSIRGSSPRAGTIGRLQREKERRTEREKEGRISAERAIISDQSTVRRLPPGSPSVAALAAGCTTGSTLNLVTPSLPPKSTSKKSTLYIYHRQLYIISTRRTLDNRFPVLVLSIKSHHSYLYYKFFL